MNERLTKIIKIKIAEDTDLDNTLLPLVLVTFQTEVESKEVIKEKTIIQNSSFGNDRYHVETPIVFIRKDCLEDLKALNIANLVFTALENKTYITTEHKLKKSIAIALSQFTVSLDVESHYQPYADVYLKRPNHYYQPYVRKLFTSLAEKYTAQKTDTEEKQTND